MPYGGNEPLWRRALSEFLSTSYYQEISVVWVVG